jgi:hypothetical protein
MAKATKATLLHGTHSLFGRQSRSHYDVSLRSRTGLAS